MRRSFEEPNSLRRKPSNMAFPYRFRITRMRSPPRCALRVAVLRLKTAGNMKPPAGSAGEVVPDR